jgi:hypothetical protein
MGRWAQRRLGNGGGGSGAAPILLLSAQPSGTGNEEVIALFSANIDAADFTAADFELDPTFLPGSLIGNDGPDTLIIFFGVDTSAGFNLNYSGTAPNVATPQSVPIT